MQNEKTRPKRPLLRVLIWIALLTAIALGGLWRTLREHPFRIAKALGFVPVDVWHPSPAGSNGIRVIVTDRGAMGYGGVFVYQWSPLLGYQEIWRDVPAIAIPDSHSVRWVSEETLDVTYTSPGRGTTQKHLLLK